MGVFAKAGRPKGIPNRPPEERKIRNITVDADLVELLNGICDQLEPDLGFRPTLSQALRHLIRRTQRKDPPT